MTYVLFAGDAPMSKSDKLPLLRLALLVGKQTINKREFVPDSNKCNREQSGRVGDRKYGVAVSGGRGGHYFFMGQPGMIWRTR